VAIRELIAAIEHGTPHATGGPLAAAHRGMELLFDMAHSHLQNGARVRLPLQNRGMYVSSR
jgi:hypothetical protein